jgi:uncharacterized caspase-like protein
MIPLVVPWQVALPPHPKMALVIGNGAYYHGGVELPHAVPSATAVTVRLTELGYAVVAVNDAALGDMHAAFEAFRGHVSAGCSGSAVIYYCGHGWQDAVSPDCLLVPVDFDGSDLDGVCRDCFC